MDRVENRFKYPKHEGMKFSKDNPRQRSRTIVSMAKECNVNEIIRKYKKTGQVPHPFDPSGVGATPIYGDFSSGADFNAIQNTVVAVRSAFDSLPAAIRARFGHDPAQLLDFFADFVQNMDYNRTYRIHIQRLTPAIIFESRNYF